MAAAVSRNVMTNISSFFTDICEWNNCFKRVVLYHAWIILNIESRSHTEKLRNPRLTRQKTEFPTTISGIDNILGPMSITFLSNLTHTSNYIDQKWKLVD